ncbi:Yip1 family protein [Candidatus Viridilinea mediisalina]|uniref:YIP1 family protein n=1 Tax=Candidatus Viridilinea mediisalina TaxID=2024553 RepID=A0A2A6RM01_9CHLR|nr:Yip1 family protein [Candidatus Viridilinea mediisalina]PDW03880.1 YIP1 family protein [Candidatus Viridilinea mediisalina]
MIELFNGALTLNRNVMLGLREAPDGVRRGFLLILFVGLLVGAVNGINDLIRSATPERTVQNLRNQVNTQMNQLVLTSNSPATADITRVVNENKEPFFTMMEELLALQTPLPRPVALVFQLLAATVSRPLSYLGWMLLGAVAAHIIARQLGGQGSIQQMVALGSLSVAPRALDALAFIPIMGGTFSMIAWVWGLVVMITATSVAHRLDVGKAAMAVLFIPLLLIVLGFFSLCMLLALLVAAVGG